MRLRYQGRQNAEPVLNAGDLDQRSRLGGVEVSGFLGLDILDRTRIVIDTVSPPGHARGARSSAEPMRQGPTSAPVAVCHDDGSAMGRPLAGAPRAGGA